MQVLYPRLLDISKEYTYVNDCDWVEISEGARERERERERATGENTNAKSTITHMAHLQKA